MIDYPNIDPVIINLYGPFAIRWYGVMYILGFLATFWLVKYQIKRFAFDELKPHFENLNMVLILSVIVGGRLGYVLFYNLSYYLNHPLEILNTTTGGMSFHGACLTLIIAGWIFTKKHRLDFWKCADFYVATIPIGLGLGRIGNFINGELFGRVTDLPWGMVFPAGGPRPRHPSQLYEALLEGFLLFLILWHFKSRPWKNIKHWPHGSILALFLVGYGFFRIVAELAREPDPQVGYLLGLFTMGQLLSCGMVLAGILLWGYRMTQQNRATG